MPRTSRPKSLTNLYHIIIRGLNKEKIFNLRTEKKRILKLIKEHEEKYEVKIYGYCIMSNHLHLLLEAEMEELASFMSRISASYAQYYNYKHQRIGYVFQDRYRSQCINNDSYFWNCLRYIHLNPVKARICGNMEDYIYSSIQEFFHPCEEEERVLSEDAYAKVEERFGTRKDFVNFHNMSDRCVFYDMPEDEFLQRKEIAWDILNDMEYDLKLPAREILDYTKTRNKFEQELKSLFVISAKAVKDIRGAIENELRQDKC